MRQQLFFLLLLVVSSTGCKKNVDFTPEIRPNEFWVRYSIVDETGSEKNYSYRGEDTILLNTLSGYVGTLGYFSDSDIQDSIKQINAGLSEFLAGTPFAVRLNWPDLITDPFAKPEWTASELENLLYPGKTFDFGEAPGEAKITLEGYPGNTWSCFSSEISNQNGYFRVLEVTDYGAPEIGIPYFGKKVKIAFSTKLVHSAGMVWTLHDGEAVLFFQYYTF
ncbi:MAG: hypothetical protein KA138_07285 [Saprospiraceae bacterium]|nr:hypothetical protein [Saprospiraceae bacterium]